MRYDEVFGPERDRPRVSRDGRATNGYVYPASTPRGLDQRGLPMGARLRLKASREHRALRPGDPEDLPRDAAYGLIVADNGSDLYVSGTYDTRWNNDVLNPAFRALTASDFEVVNWATSSTASPPSSPTNLRVVGSVQDLLKDQDVLAREPLVSRQSLNPSASTSRFASATLILCSNRMGMLGSSLRYSRRTRRPVRLEP